MNEISRRQFISAGIGTSAFLGIAPLSLASESTHILDVRRRALGNSVRIQLLANNRSQGDDAIAAAFSAIELVESSMSLYREDSEIARLNRDRSLQAPSQQLLQVLTMAQDIAHRSEGAFDISIQPLWDLYRRAQTENQLPAPHDIENARRTVDFRKIRVSKTHIQLDDPVKSITLNGIAQGFATDAAKAALKNHGILHALVDCGELAALGRKHTHSKWKVGIQHPRDKASFAALCQIEDRCLATSGDYETAFSKDYSQHHIFDPNTGRSPSELASASVLAPNTALADALSTTVLVMGIRTGLDLVSKFEGTDALLLTKDGRQFTTAGFPLSA